MSTSAMYLRRNYKAEVNKVRDKGGGETAEIIGSKYKIDFHNFFISDLNLKWSMLLW